MREGWFPVVLFVGWIFICWHSRPESEVETRFTVWVGDSYWAEPYKVDEYEERDGWLILEDDEGRVRRFPVSSVLEVEVRDE